MFLCRLLLISRTRPEQDCSGRHKFRQFCYKTNGWKLKMDATRNGGDSELGNHDFQVPTVSFGVLYFWRSQEVLSTELSEALRQLEHRDLIRYTLLGLLSLDMTNLMIQRFQCRGRKQVQVAVVTEVAGPTGLCFLSRQTQDPMGRKDGMQKMSRDLLQYRFLLPV